MIRSAVLFIAAAPLMGAEPGVEALQLQVRQLGLEVKSLKLDLCRLTLQQIAADVAPLQRELEWIQKRLAKLEAEDRAVRDRTAAVEQQFASDRLSPEERREMEQLESGRAASEASRIAAEREKLKRREGEITQHTQSQWQTWRAISAAAAHLEAELRPTKP